MPLPYWDAPDTWARISFAELRTRVGGHSVFPEKKSIAPTSIICLLGDSEDGDILCDWRVSSPCVQISCPIEGRILGCQLGITGLSRHASYA